MNKTPHQQAQELVRKIEQLVEELTLLPRTKFSVVATESACSALEHARDIEKNTRPVH